MIGTALFPPFIAWRAAMSTASTAANSAGETATDAIREARKTASAASGNLESDLQTLREEFARLADQVAGVVAGSGSAAWRRAKSSIDDAVAEAEDKGREAASAVREVSSHFVDAIDESIKTRPYTTLAIVAGVAFLFGATWRR
jgi:ElaB/YqjD/DUF883 family membrane-anchored ribosome-binding protein